MTIQAPKFDPVFSWGTVFTIIGGLFVAGGVWVAFEVSITKAHAETQKNQSQIESIEARVSRLEGRLDRRLDSLDTKIDRLLER